MFIVIFITMIIYYLFYSADQTTDFFYLFTTCFKFTLFLIFFLKHE